MCCGNAPKNNSNKPVIKSPMVTIPKPVVQSQQGGYTANSVVIPKAVRDDLVRQQQLARLPKKAT